MNQQLAYKILAAFLVITMLGSVFAYLFIGSKDGTTQETRPPDTDTEKYNPEFWIIEQPFYSISDALGMTPAGAVSANFVDLENMPPEMIQWTRQEVQLIQEVDSIYKSNTTKMFYAKLEGEGKE